MLADWDPRRLTAFSPTSRRFVAAGVGVYLLITGFVAMHHEMWRDEADGWLFARDGNFARIVDWSRHAGTPTLWYFLVAPLARVGLPAVSQQLLHLLIAAAAVAILLAVAPFTRLTRVLIASSYFFSYEYSVIVRSYALTILLAFTVTALWPWRRERPMAMASLLVLLFNTNAQGFFIAGAFAVLFALECFSARAMRGRNAVAAVTMLGGALLSWWQVRTPLDPARTGATHVFNRTAFPLVVGNAWFPGASNLLFAFAGGMVILLAVTLAIRHSREAVFLLWFPVATLGLLHTWVWVGGLRHAGFFMVATLPAMWVALDSSRRAGHSTVLPHSSPPVRTAAVGSGERVSGNAAIAIAALLLNASLLFSTAAGIRVSIADTKAAFSGAKEMAGFIRSHHIDRDPIAAHNLTQCEALLPYLPGRELWYAGLRENGTYLKWDAAMERALDVPYPVAEARAREHFRGTRWTLLLNVEMPAPETQGYRLLYANQIPVFEKRDERYWLYQPLHLGPMTAEGHTP